MATLAVATAAVDNIKTVQAELQRDLWYSRVPIIDDEKEVSSTMAI